MGKELNRQARREMDVLIKKRKQSVVDSITPETEELWKQAQLNLQWLTGDPIKTSDGCEVDFSMFDFLMATTKWTAKDMTSDLTMLQRFWVTMFPYLDNVIGSLVNYKIKFKELYGIEGQTLKKFALQNLELQCRQLFMKEASERCLKGEVFNLEIEFRKFHKDFKAKSDAEIVKIRAKEEERNKRIEDKQKKNEQEVKNRAFAAHLQI